MAESILAAILGLKGSRVEIPPFKPIDQAAAQSAAIAANTASIPALESQAAEVNTFNQNQIFQMLRRAIPGFDEGQEAISKNLVSGIKGELPQSVIDQSWLKSISRSISGGTGGLESGQGRNLVLRDLNLNALDYSQKSMSAFERWTASTAALTMPHMFDITASFRTPQQWIAQQTYDRDKAWEVQFLRNKAKAMPSPTEQALGGFLDWIATTGESMATMGLGNLMGGGSFMGGGGGGGGSPGGGGGGGGMTGSQLYWQSSPTYPDIPNAGTAADDTWLDRLMRRK